MLNNLEMSILKVFISTFFITGILEIVDGPHNLNTIEDQQALFKVELDTEATKFNFKWFKGDQELKADKKYKIESYGNFAVLKVRFCCQGFWT